MATSLALAEPLLSAGQAQARVQAPPPRQRHTHPTEAAPAPAGPLRRTLPGRHVLACLCPPARPSPAQLRLASPPPGMTSLPGVASAEWPRRCHWANSPCAATATRRSNRVTHARRGACASPPPPPTPRRLLRNKQPVMSAAGGGCRGTRDSGEGARRFVTPRAAIGRARLAGSATGLSLALLFRAPSGDRRAQGPSSRAPERVCRRRSQAALLSAARVWRRKARPAGAAKSLFTRSEARLVSLCTARSQRARRDTGG